MWRRNKGDFFLACVYMNEMSTPFLSLKAILEKVNRVCRFYNSGEKVVYYSMCFDWKKDKQPTNG